MCIRDRVHTAHDQPRQASSQQTHSDKADLIAKEAKDNGQIVAQITAQTLINVVFPLSRNPVQIYTGVVIAACSS